MTGRIVTVATRKSALALAQSRAWMAELRQRARVETRELLVTSDAERRRLVYAISGERVKHYSAAAQVLDDGRGGTRFNWTIDVLPNELASYISGQMDLGVAAMQKALERKAA